MNSNEWWFTVYYFYMKPKKENSETIISSFILWHWMRGIIVMLWFNLCVMVLFFMRSMVVISALRGQQKHKIGCVGILIIFFEKLILPIIVCWQVFVILSLSMRFVFHSKITLVKYYQCSCLCEFFWWLLTKIIRKRGHQSFLKVCF